MTLRTAKERLVQTCAFELGGLLLVSPVYNLIFAGTATESILLIALVALAVMIWSPLHNTAFDWLDLRLSGRVASDRPHRLRMVHALSHEITAIGASFPVIVLVGGHGVIEALIIDFALTVFYTAYAYVFHIAFDWLRPVR